MVFIDWNIIDFGNKLDLFLRRFIKSDWLAKSVEMIISKRFLSKLWSWVWSHHCHLKYWSRWEVILDGINISCYQFELCIDILFATIVVNCHPSSNISSSFLFIQDKRVISRPSKTSCPISHLARSLLSNFTPDFPVEGRSGEESIRKFCKFYTSYFIKYLNSIFSLNNITRVIAKKLSTNFSWNITEFHI